MIQFTCDKHIKKVYVINVWSKNIKNENMFKQVEKNIL